jgi:hypothetical protein
MDSTATNTGNQSASAEAVRLVASLWPQKDRRHRAYLALSGALLRAGWPVDRVEALVEAVAVATEDEDGPEVRVANVAGTAAKIRDNKPASGWPKLAELLAGGWAAVGQIKHALGLSVTLAELAEAKKLPPDFLRAEGLHDLDGGGVGFDYKDAGGKTVVVKTRTALERGSYRWPKGQKLMAYGEHRLADAVKAGHLVLCEGETDALTLWFHGEPALGLPGADTVNRTLDVGHVSGLPTVYVTQEPGGSGESFVEGVRLRLGALGWSGELRRVRLDGHKDPSDLHVADPQLFMERWRSALESAEKIEASVPPSTWPDPVPLDAVPDVEPFPVEVLPEGMRRLVLEGAAAMHCPTDYFAVPALVMAAGAIGNARALAIKGRHLQRPCLYAAVVGPPGSAKSPAQEVATAPVDDEVEAAHAEWDAAMEGYEKDLDDYEAAMKEWKKAAAGQRGDRPEKPERPVLRRLIVNDTTAEAVVPILRENPRGVTLVKDELTGWVQAMDQYREGGKGADRQFWLSAWSGAAVCVDRKKTHEQGPLRVRNPFICVFGGIVPGNLVVLRGDAPRRRAVQDGFFDRVLPCYPPEPAAGGEDWLEISEEAVEGYGAVLRRLRTLEMVPVQEGAVLKGWRPFVVRLTSCGRIAWQRFTEAHADERNAEHFPSQLVGPWSKLRGYCGRLALLLHFLRWAGGETDGADVDGQDVDRAARLVGYFKSHMRKVHSLIDADPQAASARRALRWLGNSLNCLKTLNGFRVVSKSELHAGVWGGSKKLPEVEGAVELLVRHGYLRPVPEEQRPGPGRKPSPRYQVHPSVFSLGGVSENSDNSGNEVEDDPDADVFEGEVP